MAQIQRLFLTTHDLMKLTGQSYSSSVRLYNTILDAHRKQRPQRVSVNEFAAYMNVGIDEVRNSIQNV